MLSEKYDEASFGLPRLFVIKLMKVYIYRYDNSISSELCARDALERFTGKKGESFAFFRGRYGKPYVKGEEVFFSVSHSFNLLICAVSRQEVGADVEKKRAVKSYERIARRCFPEEEICTEDDFFEAWVKEEAYLKYKGIGFSEGVRLSKREDASIKTFSAEEGYAFAVCAKEEEIVEIVKLFS